MVALPHIVEEAREDEIWKSVQTVLTKLIEEDLGKAGNGKGAGKGKEVVEGGVGQATGGGQFGGGKRAKVGMVAIPGLWRVCFPPVLIRPARRLLVEVLRRGESWFP